MPMREDLTAGGGRRPPGGFLGPFAGKLTPPARRPVVLFSLALLLLPSSTKPAVAQAPKGPRFALHTADGATVTGRLRDIGSDWTFRLRGNQSVKAGGASVVSLRRTDITLPPLPAPGVSQVFLANGGRLPGTVEKIADDRLQFRPQAPVQLEGRNPLSLPLSTVSVLWLAAPRARADTPALVRRLSAERRTRDVLFLRNGDRIEGTLQSLEEGEFQLEGEGKKTVRIPQAKVAVAAFNTELISRARPKGLYGHLVLSNGSRLVVTSVRLPLDGDTLRCQLPVGGTFEVAVDQVAALDLRQGCALYLSDLKPAAYRHTPFFGVRWPYVLDGSVAGNPLRLAGSTYDKGVGLHSKSRLTYDLPAGYRFFEALVGLDENTGRRGRARVKVLVNDKAVDIGWDKDLTGNDKPLPIRVKLPGKQTKPVRLTLQVDFGQFGDVQGHINWVDARLVK